MESRVSALSDDDTTGLETLLAIVEDELMAATSDDASSSAGYVPWEVVSRRMAARGRPWDARCAARGSPNEGRTPIERPLCGAAGYVAGAARESGAKSRTARVRRLPLPPPPTLPPTRNPAR